MTHFNKSNEITVDIIQKLLLKPGLKVVLTKLEQKGKNRMHGGKVF